MIVGFDRTSSSDASSSLPARSDLHEMWEAATGGSGSCCSVSFGISAVFLGWLN